MEQLLLLDQAAELVVQRLKYEYLIVKYIKFDIRRLMDGKVERSIY